MALSGAVLPQEYWSNRLRGFEYSHKSTPIKIRIEQHFYKEKQPI